MIVLLNPNSSPAVTDAIARAAGRLNTDAAVTIDQLEAAPPAIESSADVAAAEPLVVEYAKNLTKDDILIIACHSDPGLKSARTASEARIIGIGEASMLVACSLADQFGIVSLTEDAVQRKQRMVEQLRLASRCAAIKATDTGVLHGVESGLDLSPYISAAEECLALGSQSLVLGCAGMADIAAALQEAIDAPVVEPVQAALAMAVAL